MQKILVIDDAEEVQLLVESALHSLELQIDSAYSVKEALEKTKENLYQLVVIDIALPDGNGFDLFLRMKNLAAFTHVPFIFLTSNEEVSSIVSAFSLGAEDYIVKPFRLLELRARIERRLRPLASAKKEGSEDGQVMAGELVLNLHSQRVKVQGKEEYFPLSPREFKILLLLAKNPDHVFSRKSILDKIWGEQVNVTSRTVDAHICYLRKKLNHFSPYIESIPGEGYRFNPKR
jgi:DNA-binding response OmpR family regulator